MLGTYEKMQKDMKIGPMEMGPNGIPRPKPYAEYPKLVKTGKSDAKGRPIKRLVQSAEEELRLRAFAEISVPEDPRVLENNALAAQVAELQARLAAYERGETQVVDTLPPRVVPLPDAVPPAQTFDAGVKADGKPKTVPPAQAEPAIRQGATSAAVSAVAPSVAPSLPPLPGGKPTA